MRKRRPFHKEDNHFYFPEQMSNGEKNEIELHNIPMRFMSKERNLIRVEFLSFLTLSLYN